MQGMAPKHVRRQAGEVTSQSTEQLAYDPHHFPVWVASTWLINVIPQKRLAREREGCGLSLGPGLNDQMLAKGCIDTDGHNLLGHLK